MNFARRQFLQWAAGAAALPATSGISWAAEIFPSRPIHLIVPFPAGGPTDIVARPLAQLLGEALKTSVVVDNRGGAGGSVGANVAAKSEPDGYTLFMATVGTHAINKELYKNLPYDPVHDFTPISLVAAAPVTIVVHPSLPAEDLTGLVALALPIRAAPTSPRPHFWARPAGCSISNGVPSTLSSNLASP